MGARAKYLGEEERRDCIAITIKRVSLSTSVSRFANRGYASVHKALIRRLWPRTFPRVPDRYEVIKNAKYFPRAFRRVINGVSSYFFFYFFKFFIFKPRGARAKLQNRVLYRAGNMPSFREVILIDVTLVIDIV